MTEPSGGNRAATAAAQQTEVAVLAGADEPDDGTSLAVLPLLLLPLGALVGLRRGRA